MKLTLVRNATLVLETSRGKVLVDPMLRAAGSTPPIDDTPNPRRNPLVELPVPAADVVRDVSMCIVTHLHGDHFDDVAAELLPRDLPLLTQPDSVEGLRARGFTNVATDDPEWPLTRGRHGTGKLGEALGAVSGRVMDGVYVAGDTIWCDEVAQALEQHRPRAIVVNGSGARFNEGGPIVMDAEDVRQVRAATDAAVVVVHLEAMNHCLESRATYRAIGGVIVPDDGETIDV